MVPIATVAREAILISCEDAGISDAKGRDKRPFCLLVFAGVQSLRYRMRATEESGRCVRGRFAAMPKVSPLDQLCAP